jgi:hypothetical protein
MEKDVLKNYLFRENANSIYLDIKTY